MNAPARDLPLRLLRQPGHTRLLVSVRDEAEALVALAAGVDFIDLKEPARGALGGLTPAAIRGVRAALGEAVAARGPALPRPIVSATIGDWPMDAVGPVLQAVAEVDGTGVDLVKVGIVPAGDGAGPGSEGGVRRLIDRLACTPTCRAGRLVPVLIADRAPVNAELVEALLALPIPALLLDTADKAGGSLLDRHGAAALAQHLARVHTRRPDVLAGLAGSLRLDELASLRRLAPDIAGFRGAACAGGRSAAVEASRVQALVQAVAGATVSAG